ncbi:MAG: SDR family oxidoreductase [Planctomycetes bacterium]|nr:SDR family oxidoreductase [Planctomycetota bacterium]
MKLDQQQTFFMTGSTGFLGQYILRDLLAEGQRVVAMLRPPVAESGGRLRAQMQAMGSPVERFLENRQLLLVEGMLPNHLPEIAWDRTDAVVNCAASLQLFSDAAGDPYRTNVAGMKAVLDWTDAHRIHRLHAVSTAYTCGWNSGLIREQFHTTEPRFQTDYEKSKWQAESLMADWASRPGRTVTLYRPSFLIGDSETGYTCQFAGFYQFARLVSVLKKQYFDPNNGAKTYIPLRIPGRPEDRQNIVPVDFASRMIAAIVLRPELHGRIYHLTNPEGPTNNMMKRCYEDYFGLHGGYFADPSEVIGKCSQAESLLWDQYHLLTPRVVHTPEFDTTHTREAMQAADIQFPELTPERVYMLFDFAAARDWGRHANGKTTSNR